MLQKRHIFLFLLFLLFGGMFLAPKTIFGLPLLLNEDFNDGNQVDGLPAHWEEILSSGNWLMQNGKYVGTTVPNTGLNSRTLAGDLVWSNYAVEATLKSVSGVDRHLLFRFDQNRSVPKGYAVKYRDAESGFSGHIELQKAGLIVVDTNDSFKSKLGESHRLRIEGIGNRIKVFVDGQKYIDYIDDDNPILTGKIGLLIESSGSGLTNITEYDDVLVEQISNFSDETLTATPTVAPTFIPISTPTPTITPNPTPVSNVLSVSDIKQYSSPWGSQTYDSANVWSNNPTINRWGCALTSASMVLKYWGHNINPDQLNTWLKSQSDGYLWNGLLNWLAVSRYTKQHDSISTPTLEYRRLPATLGNIETEIGNGRPSILKLPGHFVVGKGYEDGGNYYINDPATTQSTLGYYNNSYLALNQFKPSHTDLSYILLTINPEYTLSVFNSLGNMVGEFNLEEPLLDQVGGVSTSGSSLGMYILPVPDNGTYRVEIVGPSGIYTLNSYIYNTDGDVTLTSFSDTIETGKTDKIEIVIDDEGGNIVKNEDFYKSIAELLLTPSTTTVSASSISNSVTPTPSSVLSYATQKSSLSKSPIQQPAVLGDLTSDNELVATPISKSVNVEKSQTTSFNILKNILIAVLLTLIIFIIYKFTKIRRKK